MTTETWLDLRNVEALLGDRPVLHKLNLQLKLRQSTTCLLYTSPSPRDGLLSRMPSSA